MLWASWKMVGRPVCLEWRLHVEKFMKNRKGGMGKDLKCQSKDLGFACHCQERALTGQGPRVIGSVRTFRKIPLYCGLLGWRLKEGRRHKQLPQLFQGKSQTNMVPERTFLV